MANVADEQDVTNESAPEASEQLFRREAETVPKEDQPVQVIEEDDISVKAEDVLSPIDFLPVERGLEEIIKTEELTTHQGDNIIESEAKTLRTEDQQI